MSASKIFDSLLHTMALAMSVVSLLPAAIAVMVAVASWGAYGDEASTLLAFKAELAGSSSSMLASWNGSTSIWDWEGVTCSGGQVVALSLPSYGHAGALSPAIGNLTFLRTLNLKLQLVPGRGPSKASAA